MQGAIGGAEEAAHGKKKAGGTSVAPAVKGKKHEEKGEDEGTSAKNGQKKQKSSSEEAHSEAEPGEDQDGSGQKQDSKEAMAAGARSLSEAPS